MAFEPGPAEEIDIEKFKLEADPAEFEPFVREQEPPLIISDTELAVAVANLDRWLAREPGIFADATAPLDVALQESSLGGFTQRSDLDEAVRGAEEAEGVGRRAIAALPLEAWETDDPGEFIAPPDAELPEEPEEPAPPRPALPPPRVLGPIDLGGSVEDQARSLAAWLQRAGQTVERFPVGGTSNVDGEINAVIAVINSPGATDAARRLLAPALAELINVRGATVRDPLFWFDPATGEISPSR